MAIMIKRNYDCAPGLWFTFGGWWWLKQVPYQHHIWEFGWIFNIFFWFWLLTRACRKAAYRTATLFLRGKMGQGRRAPIPACIGNKTHGWNIYLLLMIHTELTLSENLTPPPPTKMFKVIQTIPSWNFPKMLWFICYIFRWKNSLTSFWTNFKRISFFSLMFLYPLLQLQKSVSSTLRKAESIWGTRVQEEKIWLENPQEVWICTSVKIEIQFPRWNMNLHRFLQ